MFLLALLISLPNHQTDLELVTGSYTYHYIGDKSAARHYDNKASNDGNLIANPLLGLKLTDTYEDEYTSATIFGGENSLGNPMGGLLFSVGNVINTNFRIGLAFGGYFQDQDEFDKLQITNPANIGDFMPVAGMEANFRINFNDWFIGQNNIISIGIINHTLSIGTDF